MYQIHPFCVGSLLGVDRSTMVHLHHFGEKMDVACIMWVLTGGPRPIVVDVGPADAASAMAYHKRTLQRRHGQDVPSALDSLGLRPADVELVILTHLHWDHVAAAGIFPAARFAVQRREWDYACNPLPRDAALYESHRPDACLYRIAHRMDLLDGDAAVAPGMRVLALPGHSPGSQGVLVETSAGAHLIAGDQFDLYENVEQELPVGIFVDLFDWYASTRKAKSCGATVVLPAHDPAVAEHGPFAVA